MLLKIFEGMIGGTVIMLVLMFVYLVPTFIAGARHTQNRIAILNLNLLLGWTLIGWLVALVWSMSSDAAQSEFSRAKLAPAEEIRHPST